MRVPWQRILYVLVALVAIAYLYDYASVRLRMGAHKSGDPFDVVTYPHLLAIPEKGNRVEYALDAQSPMRSDPCVHSLFPHFGYTPCWYVRRKAQTPTQMTIALPAFRLRCPRHNELIGLKPRFRFGQRSLTSLPPAVENFASRQNVRCTPAGLRKT